MQTDLENCSRLSNMTGKKSEKCFVNFVLIHFCVCYVLCMDVSLFLFVSFLGGGVEEHGDLFNSHSCVFISL